MENQEDSEDYQVDTSHCPVCGKKCKKLLLHLNKAENCKTNVCPDFHLKLQQMSARKRGRKVRENVANWRKANLDKARENMAKWRKSNPVKATEQSRESVEKKRAKNFEEKRKRSNRLILMTLILKMATLTQVTVLSVVRNARNYFYIFIKLKIVRVKFVQTSI